MKKIDLDKESAIKALKNNQYSLLKYFKPELMADKEVIDAAFFRSFVKIVDFKQLQSTSHTDKKSVLINLEYAKYINESLLKDLGYMDRLMKKCSGYIFNYLPAKFRNNKELFKVAIQYTGHQYFKKNKINPENMRENGGLCHYVDFELGLVKSTGASILNDKALMLLAMQYEPSSYYYLSEKLKADKEIRCAMFEVWPYNGYVMINDKSIDTVGELNCFIAGIRNGNRVSDYTLKEMMGLLWDEKVNDVKKLDSDFIRIKEQYGF